MIDDFYMQTFAEHKLLPIQEDLELQDINTTIAVESFMTGVCLCALGLWVYLSL
jgi:hypothetical protein